MQQVSIVGGGIAGLTLGVLLRERGIPVALWEAHNYPRHRVCGEFVSGRGAELLRSVVPEIGRRASAARTVRFFTNGKATSQAVLPLPGLSIPRWELDQLLATRFVGAGGQLLQNSRWTETYEREGVVRASGRRINAADAPWSGLKLHLESCPLSADLEMHFSSAGYLGISKLPQGANLCALVSEDFGIEKFRAQPLETLARLADRETAERLRGAVDPKSVCAVTGISFGASASPNECCIGDALRMIQPFTGNGMSIAVESAFAAAEPLAQFSAGARSWKETLREVNRATGKLFRSRFAVAGVLQKVANRSWTRGVMLSALRTFQPLLPLCFQATR